jgi:hypothetical protein
MYNITKKDIIFSLNSIGLKPIGDLNYSKITFEFKNYTFDVDINACTYVRFPTKNRTEVKFKSTNELVSKIKKFFNDNDKKAKKEKDFLDLITEKEKIKNNKFNELCNNYSFKKIGDNYYYKKHIVLPRLNKDNVVYFRIIVAGEIKDITPSELIILHDFLDK